MKAVTSVTETPEALSFVTSEQTYTIPKIAIQDVAVLGSDVQVTLAEWYADGQTFDKIYLNHSTVTDPSAASASALATEIEEYLEPLAASATENVSNKTLIAYADNATSFRLKGPQHSSEGGADVQNYAGIFYNNAWDGIGSLKTRATFAGNAAMDVAVQSPERILILAEGSGDSSADIVMLSEANITFDTRTTSELAANNRFVIDRVDTGTAGAGNTSDVNITVSSGNLRLMSGSTTGAPILPSLTDGERDALTGVAGMAIYNETTNKLNIYNGSAWREVTDGAV